MRWALIFNILILACSRQITERPPKEKWAEFAIDNLWRQKSFSYHHKINHQTPPLLVGKETGHYIPGQAWEAKGAWRYDIEEEPFQIIAIGKFKYEKEDDEWQITQLGKEETIEARVKNLVSFGEYRPLNGAFYFKPNLLYLDPLKKEKFIGHLEIDSNRLLPKSIVVLNADSVTVWEINFSDYNRIKKITAPIKIKKQFLIEPASRDLAHKIENRLQAYEIKSKTKLTSGMLTITIEALITTEELRALLKPGRGGLYAGHWLQGKFEVDSLIVDKKIIEKVDLDFDPLSRPVVTIKLKTKQEFSGTIGLFIDDEILATKYFDKTTRSDIIHFLMLSDFRKAEQTAGKLITPDLPEISIVGVEE